MGWGALVLAAGGGYYLAKKDINQRRREQAAAGARPPEMLTCACRMPPHINYGDTDTLPHFQGRIALRLLLQARFLNKTLTPQNRMARRTLIVDHRKLDEATSRASEMLRIDTVTYSMHCPDLNKQRMAVLDIDVPWPLHPFPRGTC